MRAFFILQFVFVLLAGSHAAAMQFDLKNAGFGTFFRGEYGLAVRGDASYADSSGTGVTFDGTRTSNAGGEFGFVWSGEKSIFHLSCEVLLPKRLSGITGGVGATPYSELDTKVTAVLPQAGLDFIVRAFPASRILASFTGGYAYVTTQNIYKMKPAGTAAYPTVSDHTETGKGNGLSLQVSAAYEFEFADHATLIFDAGYRYLRIMALTTPEDVTTFTGAYHTGDTLKNNNGSDRTLDLGGAFAGAGFRFYF
jgi:hypothetical protein